MSCNKCHQAERLEGDTWCLGCISWEQLGTELTSVWKVPALRSVATDICVSAVRSVRSLRQLGGAIQSAGASRESAVKGDERKPAHPAGPPQKRPAPTADSSTGKRPTPPDHPPPGRERDGDREDVKEEDFSEYTYEEESEESGPPKGTAAKSSASRPTGRDRSPLVRKSLSGKGKDREKSDKKKSVRKKRKRGGRKHKRLHRTLHRPGLPVHRGVGAAFWDREDAGDDLRERRSPTP